MIPMAPDSCKITLKTIPCLDLYMVITMKKTVLLLLTVILLMGVCGCGMRRRESVEDRMLAYINGKYDDTFAFKSVFGGSPGGNTTKIIVSSEKFPGEDIYVVCTTVDGQENFTDNYLGVKFEEQTREMLASRIAQCFGENFYVSYFPSNLACTENGSDQTTFKEYVAEKTSGISFEVVVGYKVSADEKEIIANKVREMFADVSLIGRIFFVDDTVDFTGEDGRELFVSYIEQKRYDYKLYFICSATDGITKLEWTE